MSKVHYWELSNYNGGVLLGKWFDLEGVTKSEHSAEREEWLEALTEQTGELCEEWILGDVDGVPDAYVGEWSIDDAFFEMQEFMTSTHLDAEVVTAGVSLGIPLENIEDAYHGHYENETELAEEYAESCLEIPESIERYFDYEALGRDLAYDLSEEGGHYFHMSW